MIETEYERYTRLVNMIETVRDEDRPLTTWETRELSEMLVCYMPVYDYISDVRGFGTIWYGISEHYGNLTDLDITREYITRGKYRDIDDWNVDDWIRENGSLPCRADMMERLINDIDDEEYVNDRYRNILSTLPYHCEYNMDDDEIVHLFEVYVDEPEEDE